MKTIKFLCRLCPDPVYRNECPKRPTNKPFRKPKSTSFPWKVKRNHRLRSESKHPNRPDMWKWTTCPRKKKPGKDRANVITTIMVDSDGTLCTTMLLPSPIRPSAMIRWKSSRRLQGLISTWLGKHCSTISSRKYVTYRKVAPWRWTWFRWLRCRNQEEMKQNPTFQVGFLLTTSLAECRKCPVDLFSEGPACRACGERPLYQ